MAASLALVAAAAGCGGSSSKASGGAKAGGATVTISNFAFAPDTIQAKVGDTITVENKDSAEHTVTATDTSFDTGRFAGGTKTFKLTKAGKIEYSCQVHPFMKHAFIQVSA